VRSDASNLGDIAFVARTAPDVHHDHARPQEEILRGDESFGDVPRPGSGGLRRSRRALSLDPSEAERDRPGFYPGILADGARSLVILGTSFYFGGSTDSPPSRWAVDDRAPG
jgi:hypothetical protein